MKSFNVVNEGVNNCVVDVVFLFPRTWVMKSFKVLYEGVNKCVVDEVSEESKE